jgi:uncharacterized protein (DUF1778 family)
MMQTITLQLPEETLRLYRRGAAAARKEVEQFMVERLQEAVPSASEDSPAPLREALDKLAALDNEALREIAHSALSPTKQRLYDRLLAKNERGDLTSDERERLTALGDEARRLTVMKAQAYVLLKWRGAALPSLDALQSVE